MLKPDSLRAALTAAMPALARDPDKLAIFIDKGRIAGRMRSAPDYPNIGFEYRYQLNAVLLDFTGHPDAVFVAVMLWLHDNQPDLLQRHAPEPIAFDADVIDAKTIDLSFKLELSETVRAVPLDGGGMEMIHLPEPPAIDEFEGVSRWTPLEAIYVAGELVAGEPPGD